MKHDEKYFSIRAFTDAQKRRAYQKQGGICPFCKKHYEYNEMQGDHIIPWSLGGRTIDENLQMLCQKCNNDKSRVEIAKTLLTRQYPHEEIASITGLSVREVSNLAKKA